MSEEIRVHKKKKFHRLVLSYADLMHAKSALDYLRRFNPEENGAPGLAVALVTSFIVCYSRPFIQRRGRDILGKKHTGFGGDIRFQAKHNEILDKRNSYFAHSDRDLIPVYIDPEGFSAEYVMFDQRAITIFQYMTEQIISAIQTDMMALSDELFTKEERAKGRFQLRFD